MKHRSVPLELLDAERVSSFLERSACGRMFGYEISVVPMASTASPPASGRALGELRSLRHCPQRNMLPLLRRHVMATIVCWTNWHEAVTELEPPEGLIEVHKVSVDRDMAGDTTVQILWYREGERES